MGEPIIEDGPDFHFPNADERRGRFEEGLAAALGNDGIAATKLIEDRIDEQAGRAGKTH
jgi:hypothetical protein